MKHHSQGEMEDFIDECYVEIDEEYEFDASQFYDFTRPENDAEIHELERWFEVSGDYPHSPFIVKLNLEKILSPEDVSNSSIKDSKSIKSSSTSSDTDSRKEFSHSKKNAKEKGSPMVKDNAKAKTKTAGKISQARSSNFMEPTASHLAKKHDISSHLCTRFQRTSAKLDQKNTCVGLDNHATKRQKLETGYLKKGSHLKHQFTLSHKSSKKVTVPREPELETQLRAQRRRSKNSYTSEKQKQKDCNFKEKAHRPLPQSRNIKPEFYGSHSNRRSSVKENKLSGDDKRPESPLIQHFAKLSIETNSTSRHSSEKGLNKNEPTQFPRHHSKLNQCGGHVRVHEASMNRSLDIR